MDANALHLMLALTFLLLVVVALQALSLHKTRRIHLATYSLVRNMQRETDVLFAQIQALFTLERKLGLSDPLPPMRGWAGSPDFLLTVADEIQARRPGVVMECSSGVSTVVAARCVQLNGSGHVYSLEHETEYATKTRQLLEKYGLSEWATVLDAPLSTRNTDTPWYSEEVIPEKLAPVEMLIVDGPPAPVAKLARFPALPRLMPRMAKRSVVILDDADRPDEVEMVKRWRQLFPWLNEKNMRCEKGCVILEHEIL